MGDWRLYICLFMLVVLGIALNRHERVVEVAKHYTDTVVVFRHDTFVLTKFIEVERHTVDTVYVKSDNRDSTAIPISSYHFHEADKYDIVARGFNVSLNKVCVYPKVEYRTVTNTVEKTIVPKKWDIYAGCGLSAFDGGVAPSVHVTLKTPSAWLFGGKIGIYESKPVYGVSVQYKLTK